MSRELVETGLGWSWRPARVLRNLQRKDTLGVVAATDCSLAGFAIMQFAEDEAFLKLLAVDVRWRRRGVGHALVDWLEQTALIAGTPMVYLETRAGNTPAICFYQRLGYAVFDRIHGYYRAREDALRLGKDLWSVPLREKTGSDTNQ
ncbi:MAG: GNAT family N-acetyltransferase [Gammaproteobacteria bacterium]|nr:GNAT family N-acetyltransferase [Gammaproteobacteria bacterium]